MKLVKDVADRVQQGKIMKACHEGISVSRQSRVPSGYCHRDKMGLTVVAMWYFLHIFKYVAKNIKLCDVYQHINTNKLQK